MLFHNINYIFLNHRHICRCRLGWAGETCTDCQVLPGCQHGYCTKPLECRCHEGYTGLLCQTRMYHVVKGHPNTVQSTGSFEMIVEVLTTCHTQYTWDSSICIFLFNRTTLQVFVTYLTGALYMHPLWFYKHQPMMMRFYLPGHLVLQMQPHVISFYGVTSRFRFMFLLFLQVSRNWRYESELPLKP